MPDDLTDHPDFETLATLARPLILRRIRRMIRNESDAEDVVQETLLRAFLNFGSLRCPSSFVHWALRIARNCALSKLRGRPAPLSLDETFHSPSAPDIHASLLVAESRRRFHAALASIPENYRCALVQSLDRDSGLDAVARDLGLNVNTLKIRIHRAKRLLRQRCGEIPPPSNSGLR